MGMRSRYCTYNISRACLLEWMSSDHQFGDIRGCLHSWLVLFEFWALKGWLSGFAFKKRRLIISNLILNADKKCTSRACFSENNHNLIELKRNYVVERSRSFR
ncbi:uncharacterized protein RAG0_11683 [Rhynchosporium agropyri]|uniref:Uncharacterized protein n=1 Tax=Rhynchosporium agropyri TaxID=914238 RepID=A0A1E1L7T0_9HELO|nr:uncharacterized protein RAG0_11683 [Rhynchosporium agropyri]